MFKILMLILIAAAGWYCYDTGILEGLGNNFTPKAGKTCELVAPAGGKLYVAVSQEMLGNVIGLAEMKSIERIDDQEKLQYILSRGYATAIPDHTKAIILGNAWITVHRAPFHVNQVKLLDGEFAESKVWVRRDNVVDTPVQQLFKAFR